MEATGTMKRGIDCAWYLERAIILSRFYDECIKKLKRLDYYEILRDTLQEMFTRIWKIKKIKKIDINSQIHYALDAPRTVNDDEQLAVITIWKMIATRDDQLKKLIIRAEIVWRDFIHNILFPLEYQFRYLLDQSNHTIPMNDIKRIKITKLTDVEQNILLTRHKKISKYPLPKYTYGVPWDQTVDLDFPSSIILKKGIAYFGYADMYRVMIQRFILSIRNFEQKFMNPEVFYAYHPTKARAFKKLEYYNGYPTLKEKFWKDFNRLYTCPFTEENLTTQCSIFTNPLKLWSKRKNEIILRSQDNPFICVLTRPLLASPELSTLKSNQKNTKRDIIISTKPKKYKQQLAPYGKETLKIMYCINNNLFPPCVGKTISNRLNDNDHLKSEERVFVFMFLAFAGFPLKESQHFWYNMCRKSKYCDQLITGDIHWFYTKHNLREHPVSLYKTYLKTELCHPVNGGRRQFHTCETIGKYTSTKTPICKEMDIEDLNMRKTMCCGATNADCKGKLKYKIKKEWMSPSHTWITLRTADCESHSSKKIKH